MLEIRGFRSNRASPVRYEETPRFIYGLSVVGLTICGFQLRTAVTFKKSGDNGGRKRNSNRKNPLDSGALIDEQSRINESRSKKVKIIKIP